MEVSVSRQRDAVQKQMQAALTAQRLAAASQRAAAPLARPIPRFAAAEPEEASPPGPAVEFRAAGPCEPLAPEAWLPLVRQAAVREGLAVELLTAVIQQESAFLPCVVSSKGAMGLMQLMPATAEMLGVKDPFDPRENVDAGARFLKELLVRYGGNLALALSAYNAGPRRVDAAGGVPPIPETQDYVKDILEKLKP